MTDTNAALASEPPFLPAAPEWSRLPDLAFYPAEGQGAGTVESGDAWQEALRSLAPKVGGYRKADVAAALVLAYVARLDDNRTATVAADLSPLGGWRVAEMPLHPEDEIGRFAGRLLEGTVLYDAGRRPGAVFNGTLEEGDAPVPLAISVNGPCEAAQITVECRRDGTLVWHHAAGVAPAAVSLASERVCAMAQALAADPTAKLAAVPMLSARERKLVVEDWNRTAAAYAFDGGLVAMMERKARETPDHPAVIFKGEALDYATFDRRASALARSLRAQGAGPDKFVCLFMERSHELVIAIWAVLKAGAAYVPLNTEDPQARLHEIVADCRPVVVLTQPHLAPQVAGAAAPLMALPEGGDVPAEALEDAPPFEHEVGADDLAYMIYTSGSTGKPKGVVVEHGAIHNRVQWMHDEYGLAPEDRVLQKTPYTFDVSVWEFLWPLAMGSTMVVAEPGGHVAIGYLSHLIRDEGVTHLHFVPSVLRLFLMVPKMDTLPIRKLFCSGEALPFDLVDRFYGKAGAEAEVHNLYGPTEAAVDVSYFHCPRNNPQRQIPIGRPVTNTALYILDERGEPCPVGVPGELMIAGTQLARGYHARPDITQERFTDCPLPDSPWNRMYRTGDLACFRPDGEIVYLGRNDFQVKVNGVRIELGEIEAAIQADDAVSDAVVVAEEVAGNKVLVAYVVAASPGPDAAERLKAAVAAVCPSTYVPQDVRFLPAMPLNTSGKVDRKALARVAAEAAAAA